MGLRDWFKYETRGWDDERGIPYQTVLAVGRLRLHIFHRGDTDPDPHDHMWDFTTFPLTGYIERVWDNEKSQWFYQVVKPIRFHKRKAEHCHILLGRWNGHSFPKSPRLAWLPREKIITLVWVGRKRREWGFWVPDSVVSSADTHRKIQTRRFVPWRVYVFGDSGD